MSILLICSCFVAISPSLFHFIPFNGKYSSLFVPLSPAGCRTAVQEGRYLDHHEPGGQLLVAGHPLRGTRPRQTHPQSDAGGTVCVTLSSFSLLLPSLSLSSSLFPLSFSNLTKLIPSQMLEEQSVLLCHSILIPFLLFVPLSLNCSSFHPFLRPLSLSLSLSLPPSLSLSLSLPLFSSLLCLHTDD